MRPEDARFLERSRKQLRKKIISGVCIIVFSIAIPLVLPIYVRPAEQLLMSKIDQRDAQLRTVKPATQIEASLLEEIRQSHTLCRALMLMVNGVFRIALIYLGGLGVPVAFSMFFSAWRDRRYLRIVDELTAHSKST